MFLVSNSDNLTIPNFLQALGFMPPAGMTVDEIVIQQDSQAQAQNTLENYGFEVKEINPNYKTVSYQKKDPKLSHSFSDNYVVPEVAAAELAEFPKHIQANGQIPSGQPTPQLTVIKSPVKGITILENKECFLLRIDEDGRVLPKGSFLKLVENEEDLSTSGIDDSNKVDEKDVGSIAKAAMFANLFANDLKHMHWHASGTEFDKIHSITEELYEEALAEADEIAEIAIAAGEKMGNISDVKSFIETGESGEWEVVSEDAITWPTFVDYLKDRGEKYIDALNDIKDEDSVIEDYIHFWNKEINYKNAARAFLDQPMEADYIDAAAEAANYLGPKDEETDESLSDDVVDMYIYADAKANNSSWNGFETMSSDMIVSGGEEVSEEDLENFDSESDKFDFDDVDDEEKDDE
jgi:DNA-binding ferritin-like protein